tara:strand:- start:4492 stop:4788 length:297 start_codon:yes stop_codon:yes gene_type:complete
MLYDVLIAYIISFNLVDIYATLWFINNNLAIEANPLMQEALSIGAVFFIFVKLFLVIGGCYILKKNIDKKIARYSIWIAFFIYSSLMLYFWFNTCLIA